MRPITLAFFSFFLVFALLVLATSCGRAPSTTDPERIESADSVPTVHLSVVAWPEANGTRCMYDRPGLLYVSHVGLTATVFDEYDEWVYRTYTWDYINVKFGLGVSFEDGEVRYGIDGGRITFPGDLRAVWSAN